MIEEGPTRRSLLHGLALAGGGAITDLLTSAERSMRLDANWERVRAAFPRQQPLINLNNAAVSPPTLVVQEAVVRAYRFENQNPDVNMWDSLDSGLPRIKLKLSKLADCAAEEIALNRNSTEGLCTAIFGVPLKAGDQVLLSDWDFPSMRNAWMQRRDREGVVIAPVNFGLMDSDDAIVEAYAKAITRDTKVMLITHMLHWNGRVLPAKRLCDLARDRGIQTIVDGAQSFAQLPISFRDMGCDFFVTSLHKWMCAPISNGMMIVKKDRIQATWPLLAPFDPPPLKIDKFEHFNLGTYNSAEQSGIDPAIDFYNSIGTERIHTRLSELTRYWAQRAADIPGIQMHTPLDCPQLGGVALFSIAGIDAQKLERRLAIEHKVNVKFRSVNGVSGIRVSPQVYTSKADLDVFVSALRTCVDRT